MSTGPGWKNYKDFVLQIEPAGEDRYRVQARSQIGEAKAVFERPFDERDIELIVLKLGHRRSVPMRGASEEQLKPAIAFGEQLYDAVVRDDVRLLLARTRQDAQSGGYGLRLQLRLSDAPELADWPWELLWSGREFFALSADTPLVRYLDLPDCAPALQLDPPLRILVTVSSPSDMLPLDTEAEKANLLEALSGLRERRAVEVDFTPDATLATLQRTLRQAKAKGRPYHVWHYIGHGQYLNSESASVLAFCTPRGGQHLVGDLELGTLFDGYPEIRLVVLNACEGARADPQDPFAGVAAALVRRCIPAVIGMQFEITDRAAKQFSGEFYPALVDGLPVDAALTEARRAVFFGGNPTEWATPVLYMRTSDGKLFDIDVFDEIHQLEPEHLDPDELLASARAALEAEQRAPKLAALYDRGLAHLGNQEWPQAVHCFWQIDQIDPEYRETEALLARARQGLESQQREHRLADLYDQGLAHIDAQEWSEALPCFEEIVQIEPGYRGTGALLARARQGLEAQKRDLKLLHILEGHSDWVRSVAFSPDGTLLASGSRDETVRLWRAADSKLQRTLRGHTNMVYSVAFSPGGTLLASGSRDETVRLWRVADGKLLRTLKGHTLLLLSVAFSPDGTLLASGSADETVRLWRVADGKLLRTFEGHATWAGSVGFSPDGTLLASGSRDETVRLRRVADGKLQRTFEGHSGHVNSVAFAPDGTMLASGSTDRTVRLWRVADGKLQRTMRGHTNMVYSVAFSPDGTLLASGSQDKTVRVWRLK